MKRIFFLVFFVFCFGVLSSGVGAQDVGQEVSAGEEIDWEEVAEAAQVRSEVLQGKIVEVVEERREQYTEGQVVLFQNLLVEVDGEVQDLEYNRTLSEGEPSLKVGDRVLLNRSVDGTGEELLYVIDFVRTPSLVWLFGVFALLVLIIGRWRGLWSLVGLISSFVIIFTVVLPGIQQGFNPVLVAIVGAGLIMLVTFYLTHGVNEKTTLAIGGTFVSLVITGVMASVAVNLVRLSGFAAEEAAFLQVLKSGELNVRGLLLAGIIIGALGVLDDITISQASVVKELIKTNPKLKPKELFFKAMQVGQDHIASLVNTLILVYTGGALPLLLLFSVDSDRGFWAVLNYEIVAEEVVRTLVGSVGLVVAVPITTWLAAYVGYAKLKGQSKKSKVDSTVKT